MATPKLTKDELVAHLTSAGISAENASKYADKMITEEANEFHLLSQFSEEALKNEFGFNVGDRTKLKSKFQGIILYYSILFAFYSILFAFYSILFYSIRLLFYSPSMITDVPLLCIT